MYLTILKKFGEVICFEAQENYYSTKHKIKNIIREDFELNFENAHLLFVFNNRIIILDELNNPFYINDNHIERAFKHEFRISSKMFPYLGWYKKGDKRSYGVYDFIKSEILFETYDWIGRDIINENIFSDYQNKITCRSVFSDKIHWSFPAETLGTYVNLSNETLPYEVKYFIGAWKNLLLVQMKNATVLFLDIETGEQKHILHFKEHVMLPETVGLNDAPRMQLAGDELYWLSNQSLFKVTLQNFKVYNIRNYFNEPRELQYRFFYNTVLNGKIYFTAEKGWQTVIPHHLGVMDARTGEVLWEYKPEKSHGLSEAPQFANGKLYMRTNSKELYVFEEDK